MKKYKKAMCIERLVLSILFLLTAHYSLLTAQSGNEVRNYPQGFSERALKALRAEISDSITANPGNGLPPDNITIKTVTDSLRADTSVVSTVKGVADTIKTLFAADSNEIKTKNVLNGRLIYLNKQRSGNDTIDYLLNDEGFEGVGAPISGAGTWSSSGTINFDYSTSPIWGSESVEINSNLGYINHITTAQKSVVYDFFIMRYTSYSTTGSRNMMQLRQGGTSKFLVYIHSAGVMQIVCGGQNVNGTKALVDETAYAVWTEYRTGSGDGIARLWITELNSSGATYKPTIPDIDITNHTSSDAVDRHYLWGTTETMPCYYDNFTISISEIYDFNPVVGGGGWYIKNNETNYASGTGVVFDAANGGQYVSDDYLNRKQINVKKAGLIADGMYDNKNHLRRLLSAYTITDSIEFYFPNGHYFIDNEFYMLRLTNKKNISFVGQDKNSTIIETDSVFTNIFYLEGCENISFRNITFRNKGTTNKQTGARAIRLDSCKNITVADCIFDKTQMSMALRTSDSKFYNLEFYNNGYQPLSINSAVRNIYSNLIFKNCYQSSTSNYPIVFDSGIDCIMDNVKLDSCTRVGKFLSDEYTFENNIISNVVAHLINEESTADVNEVVNFFDAGDSAHFDFNNNKFINWTIIMEGGSATAPTTCIEIEDTVTNSVFQNWYVENTDNTQGLQIFNDCNNLVFDNFIVKSSGQEALGILDGANNIIFNNSKFEHLEGDDEALAMGGILDPVYNIWFNNVDFLNNGTTQEAVWIRNAYNIYFDKGIWSGGLQNVFESTVHNVTIEKINIKDAASRGITTSADTMLIANNRFENNVTDDVLLQAASSYVTVKDNYLLSGSFVTNQGTDFTYKDNMGYVTNTKGKSSNIASGKGIAHNLTGSLTPTFINVTPADSVLTSFNCSADNDSIYVNFTGADSCNFFWEASIYEY